MIKSSIWTIAGCMALCFSACKGNPGKVEVKEDAYYLLVGSYAPGRRTRVLKFMPLTSKPDRISI